MTLAPIELIRSGDDVTSDWLTGVFRACGELTADQSVVSHEIASLGDEAGLLGEVFRVSSTFSEGASGPASVVIKFPTDDPQQRGIADGLSLYKREIVFYNEHTEALPFGVPKVYGAVQDTESTDFVLVMQDIGHLEQVDQVAGATLEQAKTCIEQIAKFHAQWWEHADLEVLGETFIPLSAPLYLAVLPGIFEGGWPNCKLHQAENLTADVTGFGDAYAEMLPAMLAQLAENPTLMHGDFRGDNLMFDADGNLTVIDFQITGVANGMYDIGYFMCQSIDSEVRKGNDEALVQLYVDTLASLGVEFAFDDAMRLYRVALAFCLIYAVASFAAWDAFDGRQHELMTKMLTRTVAALADNDALSLVQ